LFLSGYSGNARRIRATQRNHVADYPSAFQLSEYLNMGATLEAAQSADAADAVWVTGMAQSAELVAEGLGVSYGHTVISAKEFAPATEDLVLPGSGLEVAEGTVA